jgi:hypothetical protein
MTAEEIMEQLAMLQGKVQRLEKHEEETHRTMYHEDYNNAVGAESQKFVEKHHAIWGAFISQNESLILQLIRAFETSREKDKQAEKEFETAVAQIRNRYYKSGERQK